jgi:F-type H+-transporting ATPase subunit b
MNLNLTLLGEMITFALLIWVTMKYIWPPITKAMQDREKKIADGLEAAERGKKSLELAIKRVKEQLRSTKLEATSIIDQANNRAASIIDQATKHASEEGKKILILAKANIAVEMERTKQKLQQELAILVLQATQKFLQDNIDIAAQQKLLNKIIEDLCYGK